MQSVTHISIYELEILYVSCSEISRFHIGKGQNDKYLKKLSAFLLSSCQYDPAHNRSLG